MMRGGRGGGFAEDDLKNRVFDKHLYRRMLRYLLPYMKWVVISFLILMVVAGAELVQPLIQQHAIDDYIVSDKNIAIFNSEAEADAFLAKYELRN